MSALECIRADMERWDEVRADVLGDAPPAPSNDDVIRQKKRSPEGERFLRDLTCAIEANPGARVQEIVDAVGRKWQPVVNRLGEWSDPEVGPFHHHRGRAPSGHAAKVYYPGPCSDSCPGRPSAG